MSRTPFTDALVERALLSFHGLAQNGGLVGGAVEDLFHTQVDPLLADAVRAFRRFGAPAAAELVERADSAYRRFRPTGDEDLDPADEALWDELDDEYSALVTDEVVEEALLEHADELGPVAS